MTTPFEAKGMNMDNRFALVEFQGSQLLTIFDGQTVRVAMKPLVELLGIAWPWQYEKIKGDPVLSKGVTLTVIPSERGAQETLTLPIDLMQGWLFKLNPEKVAPEARERVIAYQRECYQVLHDYWVKGAAINPRMGQQAGGTTQDILKLVDAVLREDNPAAREFKHGLLIHACEARGLVAPELPALVTHHGADLEAARIMEAIDALIAQQPDLNLHRLPTMIAVRRADLAAHGIALTAAIKRHGRFHMYGTVNSKSGGSVKAWVFWRD
jgi:hypothetical protein